MKGLVLAGGKGSRLRPFTYSGAKQLVPVANVPVIHFPLRQLVDAGVTDIGIVCGETEPQVREAIGDGAAFGARFTYLRQAAPLGIAHAALIARNFLEDDDFVLYLGDNVLLGGIEPLLDAFRAQPAVPRSSSSVSSTRVRSASPISRRGSCCAWSKSLPTRRRSSR